MEAGIIDEMMQETMEMDDEEDIEEEAEGEVNKVLFELTDGALNSGEKVMIRISLTMLVMNSRITASSLVGALGQGGEVGAPLEVGITMYLGVNWLVWNCIHPSFLQRADGQGQSVRTGYGSDAG